MTAPFPHRYELALNWKEGPTGIATAAPRPPLVVGKPPQFDGSDRWWSPEHLLLAAAASCLMATYLSLAERAKLRTISYRCGASGTLDRTEESFRFTEIRLKVALEVAPQDVEQAERLVQSAKRHCIVANSLKANVVVETQLPKPASRA